MIDRPDPCVHALKQLVDFQSLFDSYLGIVPVPTNAEGLIKPIHRLQAALRQLRTFLYEELGESDAYNPKCLHCNGNCFEDFMVLDHVWREAVPDQAERYQELTKRGLLKGGLFLHACCLEERIGRKITVNDLSPAPINDVIRFFLRNQYNSLTGQ